MRLNVDCNLANADWPKRTDDRIFKDDDKPKPRGKIKKSMRADQRDGDGDGRIYDGTKYERAATQEIKTLLSDSPESEAEVELTGSMDRAAEKMGWDESDFASVVGAPDNSYVTVSRRPEGIRIDVEHDDIERMHRTIMSDGNGGWHMINEELFLKKDSQGKGLALEMFSKQVAHAARLGVTQIETYGKRDDDKGTVGYTVWPKMGYDADLADWKATWRDRVSKEFPNAKTLQGVLASEGGAEWWAKNGRGVSLKFNVNEGSKSMRTLAEYRIKKRGESPDDKKFRETNRIKGDDGEPIAPEDIQSAVGNPRLTAAVLRKVTDRGQRLVLVSEMISLGADSKSIEVGMAIEGGRYKRDLTKSNLDWLVDTFDKAKEDGIDVPNWLFSDSASDDENAAALHGWINAIPPEEPKAKEKTKKTKVEPRVSLSDGRAIDDFSRPFGLKEWIKPSDYPSDRAGMLKYLDDVGDDRIITSDWDDDLVKQVVDRVSNRREQMVDSIMLAHTGPLTIEERNTLDYLDNVEQEAARMRRDAGQVRKELEQRLSVIREVLKHKGGLGTHTVDWSKEEFEPAKSFGELREWWRQRGVFAMFEVPDDVEPTYEGKWRYTLDDMNNASDETVKMLKLYPETEIRQLGQAYALDKAAWDENLRRNLKEEYDKKSASGKKFSKPAALKRVLKSMISEPPKVNKEGQAGYRSDYDIFRYAWWNDHSKLMALNHRAAGWQESFEKNAEDRVKDLAKIAGGDDDAIGIVDSTLRGAIRHEFGHALDETYGLEKHPKLAKMLKFKEKDVSRGLSSYAATKKQEFIAEAFGESFYEDARPMGVEFRKALDEIVKERKDDKATKP